MTEQSDHEGRAYDERGNVRPADGRWSNEPKAEPVKKAAKRPTKKS